MITRPMLAAPLTEYAQFESLRYPFLASPKIDGIRCLVHPELGPVSRSFKPIRNDFIRETLKKPEYIGFDGELMLLNANGVVEDFNAIQSGVMSKAGEPNFELWAFDQFIPPHLGYEGRYHALYASAPLPRLKVVAHDAVQSPAGIRLYAQACIRHGYEGIILRDPLMPYKSGRSTVKQQGMLKYKEFSDAEGTIIGFEELMRNENPQEHDEFGLAKRSSEKAGKVPGGTLGKLVLETQWGELRVGSGFDMALRDKIWANRQHYYGLTVTFKYQDFGILDKPRFPIFKAFRESE